MAPDTVNEIVNALSLLEEFTGNAFFTKNNKKNISKQNAITKGKELLSTNDSIIDELEILAINFENNKRKVKILKTKEAYNTYKTMLELYCYENLFDFIFTNKINSIKEIKEIYNSKKVFLEWENCGGQLIPMNKIEILKKDIKNNKVKSWLDVRKFYTSEGNNYLENKIQHSLNIALTQNIFDIVKITKTELLQIIEKFMIIKKDITSKIESTRAKDYTDPYRKMVYKNQIEMENVIGKLNENSFILEQKKELKQLLTKLSKLKTSLT